ncbi:pentapeptide repeat-containing protein [Curtobacterium sp. ISL-83]|uniref:pentapeptide repeat-containing protein n=1 Tax=Curtobacterium sp. ISL-83 TaxID=2819145 RepID=UPI001BE9B583|nr:pentapeptide repeat-containing protein [Curtobacterium sp. ISL-83]MBT2501561.1 pentapeptide repeat-containing protein [Curtobacterium sp. ISL-83]
MANQEHPSATTTRTRVRLGRRADLGADCANCFGLCCVALAFTRSADFPVDKSAGDPCTNLDTTDGCRIHPHLRDRGWKGCTVFDCAGAGQKVSQQTFAGRSWRDDDETRIAMFATFPVVRRLHDLLRYLDEAVTMVETEGLDPASWSSAFERVHTLSDGTPAELAVLDVDAEYDTARPLLLRASEIARGGRQDQQHDRAGSDLVGARLAGADLRGVTLRGSLLLAADLRGAVLDRCDLLGADLRDADLRGADLRGALFLTQMQVNAARGDDATLLPDGFTRPSHWTASPTRAEAPTDTSGADVRTRRGPSGRGARSRRR